MRAPATSIGVHHVSGSFHQCCSACLDRIGLRHRFPSDPCDFHPWRFARPAFELSGAGKTTASRRAGDSGPTGARFAPATDSRRSLVLAVRLVSLPWKLPEDRWFSLRGCEQQGAPLRSWGAASVRPTASASCRSRSGRRWPGPVRSSASARNGCTRSGR